MMNKEKIKSEKGELILRVLGFIQLICLICLISTPFIWIWFSWSLAWKIGLSGFLGAMIVLNIYKFIKKVIKDSTNEVSDEKYSKYLQEKP